MDKTLSDALAVANAAGLTDRDLASVVEAATDARSKMAEAPLVMVHPDQPGVRVSTTAEAFEVHQLSGWELAPDETPPNDELAPAAPTRAELDAAADLTADETDQDDEEN